MALYMLQMAYTAEAWAALVKNPQNRAEVSARLPEGLGGRQIGFWHTFGEYDLVAIYEVSDNVTAAALAAGIAAGGAARATKMTPLLTGEEMVEALRKAPQSGYQPPR